MLRDLLHDIGFRLRAFLRRDDADCALSAEVQFHLDRETERLVREGRSLADARREARLAFGDVEETKETVRDAWGTRVLENLRRDVARALRLARKQPGFASVVTLSLALGLGATLTAFNITWNVLFAEVALPNPGQLVAVERWDKEGRDNVFSWREITELKATPGVGALAAERGASSVVMSAGEHREFMNLQFYDGNYFSVLGVQPLHGRLLNERDDAERAPVVVLSERFAERLFPGDSNPTGKAVMIRGASFTVVGVTPRSYRGLNWPGTFTAAIPLGAVELLGTGGVGGDNRGIPYGRGDDRLTDVQAFGLVGRISTDFESAQSALAARFAACCSPSTPGQRQRLSLMDVRRGISGGKGDMRADIRGTLGMIMAGTLLVLVVVCCNIAGILLVRTTARQREIAVRLSLGASRMRLAAQLVLESAPLAVVGCLGGFGFAAWATAAFGQSLPGDWDFLRPVLEYQVNTELVGVTALLGLLCTLGFAVYPAVRATSRPLAQALRLDTRASRSRRQGQLGKGIVVAQVAVTVVLLASAALLTATLVNIARTDSGIDTDHMLLAGLGTRSTVYERDGSLPLAEEIARAAEGLPGVRAATVSTLVPLYGGANYAADIRVPGYEAPRNRPPTARLVVARPGFFSTTGMRIVSGREFTASEGSGPPVVVVSEAFVSRYLKGPPVGQMFDLEINSRTELTRVQIVGVVRDSRYDTLREATRPFVFVSLPQAMGGRWGNLQLVVRTAGPPLQLVPQVLKAVERAVPGIEVRRVRDMETQRAWSITPERLTARLAIFVGAMALVLSAIGLYGVVAYGVSRRTSEIGVRLALGARTRSVLWLVSRETVVLVGLGVAIGAALSYGANGAIQSQFYGVGPHNPLAVVSAALMLAVVGLTASIVPARRAARIDPRIVLNAD